MNRRAALLALFALLYMCPARADEAAPDCARKAAQIKPGMTRDEVFNLMQPDGGLSGAYRGERLYFPELKFGEEPGKGYGKQKFCMVNVDFRPHGLGDEVFNDPDRFASWLKDNGVKYKDGDIVVRVSAPFMDNYHTD
jgi:hypothetical protein